MAPNEIRNCFLEQRSMVNGDQDRPFGACRFLTVDMKITMRHKIDSERLNKITQDIALLKLRFPVAAIAKRTGIDKGNISKILRGKVPCSDSFLDRFYATFKADMERARPVNIADEKHVVFSFDARQTETLKSIAVFLEELAAIINQIVE